MSIWVSGVIGSLLSNCTYCYIFSKLIDSKREKNYILEKILCLIFSLCTAHTIYFSAGLRSMIMLMSVLILLKILFKVSWSKTLITTFLIHILYALSEMFVVVFCLWILKLDENLLTQTANGIINMNIGIMLVAILLIHLKFIKTIMKFIIKWYEEKYVLNLIVTVAVGCSTILFLLCQNLQGIDNVVSFIFNNIFVVGIIYFICCFFIEKTYNNRIKTEYDNLLNYVKTYEQEIVEKSKWQHEYENQLIILRDKISEKNQEARVYIDKLVKNKPIDINSQWLTKVSKFPDIGIKGLLHYKICQMIQNNIQVYVDVIDEDLMPTKIPEKLLEENLQDISMALGVYLDNAMQAASESDNKYLIVEFMCTKKQIVFQISNTYKGNVSIDKMDQERFSTKGKNHGYGLSIVRDILAKNKHLSQEKEMNGMYYVQKLIFNFE